jgi:imidazolonepropionase-like amidohydrolase
VPHFTPLEAIRIATYDGAYFHGLESELGSISRGKLGDLVVLNSDPLQNIQNTLDIAYVMKAGRLYEGATLDQVWPQRRPYAPVGHR